MQKLKWLVISGVVAIAGCLGADTRMPGSQMTIASADPAPVSEGDWYRPPVGVTWQWQLLVNDDHPLDTSYDVNIYNIDLFNTPPSTIRSLQAEGHKVICYFSAGTYETYRPDRHQFNNSDLGTGVRGWPKERWLDIRSDNVRRIMSARLDLAAEKDCDAVEPDNAQGYLANTGFALIAEDQLAFNRFIANEAHQRGLGVGLKNDLEQIDALIDYYDFSINEQCFQYNECPKLLPFIRAGKPVLNAEYPAEDDDLSLNDRSISALCNAANEFRFSTLVLPVALDDSFRVSCQNRS